MIGKKKVLSIATAGVAIASLMFGGGNAEAASYTIQKGDSLWLIAQKYRTTVDGLINENKLTSTVIYPNQILEVGSGLSPDLTDKYLVKAGDSLWKISRQYGVSISELKKWNNWTSDTIYIGQTLKINIDRTGESPAVTSITDSSNTISTKVSGYDINKLISTAKSLIGTPYKWAGTTPDGFDCSGFVYYVFNKAGMDISRKSATGYYDDTYKVSNPQIGDLVFFKNTYKNGISDVGIYLGNNEFISASDNGVSIKSLNNSYWKSHFDSIRRFK